MIPPRTVKFNGWRVIDVGNWTVGQGVGSLDWCSSQFEGGWRTFGQWVGRGRRSEEDVEHVQSTRVLSYRRDLLLCVAIKKCKYCTHCYTKLVISLDWNIEPSWQKGIKDSMINLPTDQRLASVFIAIRTLIYLRCRFIFKMLRNRWHPWPCRGGLHASSDCLLSRRGEGKRESEGKMAEMRKVYFIGF